MCCTAASRRAYLRWLLSLPPHTTTLLPLAPHPHPRPHLHYRIVQELERLNDDSNVFKLIGPVLVKQDVDDAKATVASRLELIERELCVLSHRVLTRCPQTFSFQRAPLPFLTHCFSALTSRSTPSHTYTPHTHRSERIGAEIEQKEKDQMSTRQMIMQVQQAAQAAKAAGGGGAPGGASYASAAAGSES